MVREHTDFEELNQKRDSSFVISYNTKALYSIFELQIVANSLNAVLHQVDIIPW